MINKIPEGFYKGFFFAILFLSVLGALTAIGFHSADEILGGTFSGNYIFSGNVDFTGTTSGVSGSIPSEMLAEFNTTLCPSGWSYKNEMSALTDQTKFGTSSASSSNSVTFPASNAFDDNQNTAWSSNNVVPGWIEYEFIDPIAINKVTLNPNKDTHGSGFGGVKTFNIEYYDGSSWIAIQSNLNCPNVDNVKQTYEFSNTIAAQKWRVYVTAAWVSNWVSILELEMFNSNLNAKCIKD